MNKFRFQNRGAFLTYKTHIPKDRLIKACVTPNDWAIEEIYCAHETGHTDGVPYEHSHVAVKWQSIVQSTNARIFDIEDIHPHIKPIKFNLKAEWINHVRYLGKDDPENAELLNYGAKATKAKTEWNVDIVWNQDTVQDALGTARGPSEIPGILAAYKYKPRPEVRVFKDPLPWQGKILDLFETEADDRSIWWIWEDEGCVGKSQFMKYCLVKKLAYAVKSGASNRDMSTIILGALASGWDGNAFILDLPRAAEDHKFYEALENIKDGVMTATKWAGETVCFNSPHVVVFANFAPNFKTMSKDRWKIFTVKDMDLVPWRGFNIKPIQNWNPPVVQAALDVGLRPVMGVPAAP